MDWDIFKLVALISAIITILDKAYTYGEPILKKNKMFYPRKEHFFTITSFS
jgi:hypothetical protein